MTVSELIKEIQMFFHKLNPFVGREKKRVYKWFETMVKKDTNTDTSAMFNSH
jgi:hypothetical protein